MFLLCHLGAAITDPCKEDLVTMPLVIMVDYSPRFGMMLTRVISTFLFGSEMYVISS